MKSVEHIREDALKVKKTRAKEAPRADRPGGGGLLSALGNARVQRLLRSAAIRRQSDGGGSVDDEVARAIQSKRGTGQALEESARRDLEPALGHDFSDVRVHHDAEADALNKAVRAEAFTTGRDIFFRSGNYDPGSDQGRKLLAHELTHVVQQRSAPPAQDLTVSSPQDSSELQAGDVADSLGAAGPSGASASVERAAPEEELAEASLERQRPEEEEVPGAGQEAAQSESSFPPLGVGPGASEQRPQEEQPAAQSESSFPALGEGPSASEQKPRQEEEELAMSAVERQKEEEEEIQASSIERQDEEEEEEEEVATSRIAREPDAEEKLKV